MKSKSRQMLRTAFMSIAIFAQCDLWAQSQAENYPNRPVRLVVPFAPGGSSEVVSRLVGQRLSELWKHQVVIDNRPGAGGGLGAEIVARTAPDGYTILFTNPGPAVYNVLLRKKPRYSMNDFSSIAYLGYSPSLIVANPQFPPKNAKELLAYAKANPGKINWATPGINSNPHIRLQKLIKVVGINVTHVPYKGAGPALLGAASGEVEVSFASPISAEPFLKSKQLKVLGISGNKREASLPDVPTFSEQGIPSFSSILWFGFVAPVGTSRTIIQKINSSVNKVLQMSDLRQQLEQLGVVLEGGTPEQFDAVIKEEAENLEALIKSGALQNE